MWVLSRYNWSCHNFSASSLLIIYLHSSFCHSFSLWYHRRHHFTLSNGDECEVCLGSNSEYYLKNCSTIYINKYPILRSSLAGYLSSSVSIFRLFGLPFVLWWFLYATTLASSTTVMVASTGGCYNSSLAEVAKNALTCGGHDFCINDNGCFSGL